MKNTVNSTLKIALVTALFCSAAFADGDMSNGGKSCTQNCNGFSAPVNESVIPTENIEKAKGVEVILIEAILAQFGLR